ncbi:5-formyltetrahydrofolate cyclo-ligase [Croceivirga thetidis]|uniref:5-formyltetrahydrofolate cyclo-ligase n=1 Tax=Croceivirga thetidis TaxID=2721623 RepID=A0ABX1GQT8_9FLAO|nr:5-formyltetrahydrofolate cyclo-ligase [Croceivirga thetidis]NKI31451.1 5-formyltetrahydrofolate cyclo-ligase [Croceivirga thetidis]
MLKHEIRAEFKAKRNLLSIEDIESKSLEISNRLLEVPIWKFSFFHLFLPIIEFKEIDTQPILTLLQGKDKNIVLPKVNGNYLEHFLLTDNTILKQSKWGIPEPQDGIHIDEKKIDVVFVPLLAFDLKGNRVGYGKGFYDRFLSKCKKEVVKIGLSVFEPIPKISDIVDSDIPLEYCVTPEKLYTF